MKRVIIFLLAFLLASCESAFNNQDTSELDNKEDQEKIDKLLANITKENYPNRVYDISAVYGQRFETVGLKSRNVQHILDKMYQVKPQKIQTRLNIRKGLNKFSAKAQQMKAKGKDTSAFDVLLQSEEADTSFTEIEKSFLKEAQKVFKSEDREASYYISKLTDMEKEYRDSYDLNDKEFATIVGISQSVKSFIKNLYQAKDELTKTIGKKHTVEYASIHSPALLLLQTDNPCDSPEARENNTAPDCSFDADWTEIGGKATMGAALGMLGTTSRLGYYAASGSVFGPGSAAAAAGDFAFSGAVGAASGGVGSYLDQYDRHKEWIEEHTQ